MYKERGIKYLAYKCCIFTEERNILRVQKPTIKIFESITWLEVRWTTSLVVSEFDSSGSRRSCPPCLHHPQQLNSAPNWQAVHQSCQWDTYINVTQLAPCSSRLISCNLSMVEFRPVCHSERLSPISSMTSFWEAYCILRLRFARSPLVEIRLQFLQFIKVNISSHHLGRIALQVADLLL